MLIPILIQQSAEIFDISAEEKGGTCVDATALCSLGSLVHAKREHCRVVYQCQNRLDSAYPNQVTPAHETQSLLVTTDILAKLVMRKLQCFLLRKNPICFHVLCNHLQLPVFPQHKELQCSMSLFSISNNTFQPPFQEFWRKREVQCCSNCNHLHFFLKRNLNSKIWILSKF